jgi:hypothetical protein
MARQDDLEQIVQRYLDGEFTSADVDPLNRQLRADAQFRQRFIELLNLDSALVAAFADGASDAAALSGLQAPRPSSVSIVPPLVTPSISEHGAASDGSTRLASHGSPLSFAAANPLWLAVGAAVCLSLAVAVWWQWPTSSADMARIESAQGVAELADATALGDEWREIDAGTVELITSRGARVVIEAPARFRFESTQRLRLSYGRLAAEVPPAAKGFTVVTPTGDAIDLGTRFGVDVPTNGDAEIHVFEGEVIAQTTSGQRRKSLTGGEAFRLTDKNGTQQSLRSSAFIQPHEVASLHAALAAGQQRRSQESTAALRRDPALISLVDFESGDLPPGVYRIVQGRWPGSRAPEFVREGDHMKLDVGGAGDWQQLTMAAWVRLDRFDQRYHSLLHTDGWDKNNFGQVHWMVTRYKTMRLALFGNTLAPGSIETEFFPDSRTSVLPEQGRWIHLATVYDSVKKSVRFYFNGRFDSETRQEIAYPARLGPAQIGNWDSNERRLSGRLDELLLLGRAMSDAEVQALYQDGNPYHGLAPEIGH